MGMREFTRGRNEDQIFDLSRSLDLSHRHNSKPRSDIPRDLERTPLVLIDKIAAPIPP
jgi:hypothetical protein